MSAVSVFRNAVRLSVVLLLTSLPCLHADINRWDTWQVIPGTEGIEPGPGVQLDHRELEYAVLGGWTPNDAVDLTGAKRTNAVFNHSTLTNANLAEANLRMFVKIELPVATIRRSTLESSLLCLGSP